MGSARVIWVKSRYDWILVTSPKLQKTYWAEFWVAKTESRPIRIQIEGMWFNFF